MEPRVRRALLKPLARRKSRPDTSTLITAALHQLDRSAFAASLLPELAQLQRKAREAQAQKSWKDPALVQIMADLATAMLFANRISRQEYTFIVGSVVDGLHDSRIMDGSYPELEQISASIGLVEERHGLEKGSYWHPSEGPREWRELNSMYDAATHVRFVETLREVQCQDLAELYTSDREEFDRLRERGRRSFFHKDELPAALDDVIVRYEQAYSAAVILLGAAVEGLLLRKCLRSKKKAAAVAAKLPKSKRPRDVDSPSNWTFDTLIETCLGAGWLPAVSTDSTKIYPDRLAHLLRGMRNQIHPGKVATERPWIEIDESEYAQAEVIYTTIFAAVSRRSPLVR
jgi:hypothetical protein